MSEFKYPGWVLDETGTDDTECHRKVGSGRKVTGAIRSLVNARCLQIECARMIHEGLPLPLLLYASETMIRREEERFRIRAVQMDSLGGVARYLENG